ncbi:hypothetical protein [Paenibacillus glycinis]|uniref:Uncharacterized protein n=1 Tax=Paenibacillus glycinis TaxID=2697035 RepID=A0ABW9XRU3_9BACL|nr:hypothetical protein [Paenibacillus glycinis]NBD25369.1 hypothetical protein [Paenibacillus glycinis]
MENEQQFKQQRMLSPGPPEKETDAYGNRSRYPNQGFEVKRCFVVRQMIMKDA